MIEASISFLVPGEETPVVYPSRAGGEPERRTASYEDRTVTIHDGRPLRNNLSLDDQGFLLVDHHTLVNDFYDDGQIAGVHEKEIGQLVRELTGAEEVLVFDHTRRAHDAHVRSQKRVREPVRTGHSDYTDASAPRRVTDLLAHDQAEEWLQHRFAIINVWRPIRGPVRTSPLAVCDARRVSREDLVAVERRAPERIGELYHLVYNPRQRWYYFPDMTTDEALVFKTFDSAVDGRARFAPHTAFDLPAQSQSTPGRESIESRVLVRW